MRYAQIIGSGSYVPERIMTNADFDRLLGEPVGDWLVENVGIRERHFMAEDQVTSDLAVAAGRNALERAGLQPNDLDRIIVATDTPDYLSPATAAVVQAKLGAHRAGVFDVNSACAGWVIALDVAAQDHRHRTRGTLRAGDRRLRHESVPGLERQENRHPVRRWRGGSGGRRRFATGLAGDRHRRRRRIPRRARHLHRRNLSTRPPPPTSPSTARPACSSCASSRRPSTPNNGRR